MKTTEPRETQGLEEVESEEERRAFFQMAKRGQRELSQAVADLLGSANERQRRENRI